MQGSIDQAGSNADMLVSWQGPQVAFSFGMHLLEYKDDVVIARKDMVSEEDRQLYAHLRSKLERQENRYVVSFTPVNFADAPEFAAQLVELTLHNACFFCRFAFIQPLRIFH